MISLKRILLPTNFSENSVHAQKYACAFVEQFDAELHLLHVFQDLAGIISDPVFGTPIGECIQQDSREAAEERLRAMLDPKWAEERHVVCATAQGTPFLEIIRYAKKNDIDVIVATTPRSDRLVPPAVGQHGGKNRPQDTVPRDGCQAHGPPVCGAVTPGR